MVLPACMGKPFAELGQVSRHPKRDDSFQHPLIGYFTRTKEVRHEQILGDVEDRRPVQLVATPRGCSGPPQHARTDRKLRCRRDAISAHSMDQHIIMFSGTFGTIRTQRCPRRANSATRRSRPCRGGRECHGACFTACGTFHPRPQ
ncbi:hypothetical protein ACFFX0_18225 [Citricoccus parietis]|uniref:Uncharacterized protein n=1 Tax=Citricoccus parietis TaxID=592307 RepID=A0ABV5G274_9MICC